MQIAATTVASATVVAELGDPGTKSEGDCARDEVIALLAAARHD